MAEHGSFAAGEHSRHPSPFLAEIGVADGVDPAVDAMQATTICAVRNSAGEESDSEQLRPGDDAVLPRCDEGDLRISTARGRFVRHPRTKSPTPTISPPSSPVF